MGIDGETPRISRKDSLKLMGFVITIIGLGRFGGFLETLFGKRSPSNSSSQKVFECEKVTEWIYV